MARKTLLIVDDDPKMSALIATVANENGFDTALCENGAGALKQLPTLDVCGIVMDMVMPDMDGIELVQQLTEIRCSAPVIMISGYDPLYISMAEAIATNAKVNVVARLQKPFALEALEAALQLVRAEPETAAAE